MYPFYLGIELHKKRTYVVLLDQAGQVVDERRLRNTEMPEYLTDYVPPETYAVLEATRNWPFMYDLLRAHVARVELAHPKEVKAIASAAVKTDQIDAGVLAHLARLNYLPTAYAAPIVVRDLRQTLRHRTWLVRQRTQAKNRIHAVLASYNLITPVADLFGSGGQAFLAEVVPQQLRPAAQRMVTDNLALIGQLDERIQALIADLELTPGQAKLVQVLQTIPGVGRVTAAPIVAEIGAIQRFPRAKSLCNWAGLTPRVRKSDTMVRHGRISKQGSPYLRAALKRAATVAVARRLLTVIYYRWTRNQPYYEDYPPAGEPEFLQGAVTPL